MEMAANGREAESILDDIALVKLESPAPEKDVLPLCGDRNPRHYKLAAIGMGLNETWTNWATIVEKHNKGFAVFPDVLQEVKLKENSHCFDARPGNLNKNIISNNGVQSKCKRMMKNHDHKFQKKKTMK